MSKTGLIATLLLTILCFIVPSSSQQSCKTWVSINETMYSQTYVELTDSTANTARPLGYLMASYQFEGTRPCYTVSPTGGNDRHIEVSYELQQAGGLCFQAMGTAERQCSTTKSKSVCRSVPGGKTSLSYEFFCEGAGCEAGTKLFWFRFVVESPMEDGSYDENWCNGRNEEVPSSLIQIPINVSPPTTVGTTSSAIRVHEKPLLLTLFALASMCFVLA